MSEPDKLEDVLPGITRKYVFSICEKFNISIKEKNIKHSDLATYDSAFLTGTSIGVLSVNQADTIIFVRDNKILNLISDEYNKIVKNSL